MYTYTLGARVGVCKLSTEPQLEAAFSPLSFARFLKKNINGAGAAIPEDLPRPSDPSDLGGLELAITLELGLDDTVAHRTVYKDNNKADITTPGLQIENIL